MAFVTQNIPLNQNRTKSLLTLQIKAVATKILNIIDRQTAQTSLRKVSDRHLRDIGLTRHDVSLLDSELPSNGGLMLSAIAESRAGNW